MKKYEIYKNIGEVGKDTIIENGCTVFGQDDDARKIESYDTLEEAREALKKYSADCRDLGKVYQITEYFIFEIDYEDDDDTIGTPGDIWDFAQGLVKKYKVEITEEENGYCYTGEWDGDFLPKGYVEAVNEREAEELAREYIRDNDGDPDEYIYRVEEIEL